MDGLEKSRKWYKGNICLHLCHYRISTDPIPSAMEVGVAKEDNQENLPWVVSRVVIFYSPVMS